MGEVRERELAVLAYLEAGRAAWPDVVLDCATFAQYLAARERSGALPALDHAADLYIACACADGTEAAVRSFLRAFRGVIARAVVRIDPSETFLDDVVQALSEKLLLPKGDAPPGIAAYAGRASLGGWLATTARRTALNMRRRRDDRGQASLPSAVSALGAGGNPEAALLRARFKRELEATIREGLASLPSGERALLLLHLVEGVTLPQLAMLHKVSRATIARRIAAARDALHEATRRDLRARLKLSSSEYESAVALVRSQIELCLGDVVGARQRENT
jgi:RNA polymerase sigma-70 factor (ECF subfamily)